MTRTFISGSCLMLATLSTASAWAETTIECLAIQEWPEGVLRLWVRNTGDEPLDLQEAEVQRGNGTPLPAYWTLAEPESLPPGADGYITVLPRQEGPWPPLTLATAGQSIPLAAIAAPEIRCTYAVTVASTLHVYLQNTSGDECRVTGIVLDGQRLRPEAPVDLPAGGGNVLVTPYDPPAGGQPAVPARWVTLETDDGVTVPAFMRIFDTEHTVMARATGDSDLVNCLSHIPPSIEAGAAEAIPILRGARDQLRTIKFCNMDQLASNDGPRYFAQMAERNHIEPQLAFANDVGTPGYLAKLLSELEYVRERTAPGMYFVWLFARDNHGPGKPRYSLRHIRNTAYTSLAAGSKGLELYRYDESDLEPHIRAAIGTLWKELTGLRALIADSEPIAMALTDAPGEIAARTLLCGAKGVLLFLIPVQRPEEARTVNVALTPPRPLAGHGLELGGRGARIDFGAQAAPHQITLEVRDDVRVFYLPATPGATS